VSTAPLLIVSATGVHAFDLRSEFFVQIELAYITAAFANERVIPFSTLLGMSGVIVPPDRHKEENEHEGSDCKVDLHRK
jgi:hypothetical protein